MRSNGAAACLVRIFAGTHCTETCTKDILSRPFEGNARRVGLFSLLFRAEV